MAYSIAPRLGLNVPYEWWPAPPLLKEIEAAGFTTVQAPSPPAPVLLDPRLCSRHAAALRDAFGTTSLSAIVHGPGSLKAGTVEGDEAFEGLLSYAAEVGAGIVVYHAAQHPDEPASEDALLAETSSLARLAERAERLGVRIAIENVAPVFPGPEMLSARPQILRTMARRIGSPALGLCLDIGHANVIASLRHADPLELIEPVLDATILFHVHDNLGARVGPGSSPAEIDPLRLDLHLAPGRGTVPWGRLAPYLERTDAPLMLEIHPPQRPAPAALFAETLLALGSASPEPRPQPSFPVT
jgi:sugar phosphate isomerase/epimerase